MKMLKYAEPSSIFVVVTPFEGTCFGALLEVKLEEGSATHKTQPVLETVSQFTTKDLGRGMWKFCTLDTMLYILPDGGPDLFDTEVCFPKCSGHIFDIETRKVVTSTKSPAPKWFGTHVSAYGKIYSLSDPYSSRDVPEPSFEQYDPITQSWQELCSFPYSDEYGKTQMQGYAVCAEILLFSICGCKDNYDALWAYDVIKNKWHPVQVENIGCYFRGRAVVLDKTIYALSIFPMVVVAFSITSNQNEEGHISYSTGSLLQLDFPLFIGWRSDQHLVHLGNLVFYLIQSGFDDEPDVRQPVSVTKFQIVGGREINVISSTLCEVDLGDMGPFDVQSCFTVSSSWFPHTVYAGEWEDVPEEVNAWEAVTLTEEAIASKEVALPEEVNAWEAVTLTEEAIASKEVALAEEDIVYVRKIGRYIDLGNQFPELPQAIPVPYQAGIDSQPAYEACSSPQPPEPSEVAEQFQQGSNQQEEAPKLGDKRKLPS